MNLLNFAVKVLKTPNSFDKALLVKTIKSAWDQGALPIGTLTKEDHDFVQSLRTLLPPNDLNVIDLIPPYKSLGVPLNIFLLHSIADAERNAVNMAFDTIARFHHPDLPTQFYDDWLRIGSDEARHFLLLNKRLEEHQHKYGDLPVHKRLWDDAQKSADDILVRMAAIPMLEEAKALDSWKRLVERLIGCGDVKGAQLVDRICREEIPHVSIGIRWFKYIYEQRKKDSVNAIDDPCSLFHQIAKPLLPRGVIYTPVNVLARKAAGMDEKVLQQQLQ